MWTVYKKVGTNQTDVFTTTTRELAYDWLSDHMMKTYKPLGYHRFVWAESNMVLDDLTPGYFGITLIMPDNPLDSFYYGIIYRV
jgi:hypothetical protein